MGGTHRKYVSYLGATACLLIVTSVVKGQIGGIHVVAISGEQAPDQPGVKYTGFGDFELAEGPAVAFQAQAGATKGVWFNGRADVSDYGLSSIALGDAPAPGTPGLRFDPDNLTIGAVHPMSVAVNAGLYDPTVPFAQRGRGQGVFWGFGGTDVHLLARTGLNPPDAPNGPPFDMVAARATNALGVVTLEDFSEGNPSSTRLLAGQSENSLQTIVTAQASVPQVPLSAVFGQVTDTQQVLFYGTGPTTQNFWTGPPGDYHSILPGNPGIERWSINGRGIGRVAFLGSLGLTSGEGVISASAAGEVRTLATRGQAAPGVTDGTFLPFFQPNFQDAPVVSQNGHVAFIARVSRTGQPSPQSGIWEGTSADDLKLITLADTNINLFYPQVNDLGQVAYLVSSALGDPVQGAALAVYDPTGGVEFLARPGRTLQLLTGSSPPVQSVTEAQLNDYGQLAFEVTFTDGSSGIFFTTVPEPTAFALAAGSLLLMRRRSRAGS